MKAIFGTGIDIVEVARIERSLERHGDHFRERVFTPSEIAYCDAQGTKKRMQCYAARFAAKEAISKALGTGIGKAFDWIDLEIARGPEGEPSCVLLGRAAAFAATHQVSEVHVSLSHCEAYAVAHAVAERSHP